MDTAHAKLIKARTGLLLEHPFFGSLCLRMEPKPDPTCDTAWTDGKTFAFNPGFVTGLSDAQLKGLVAHTVMHPACQHHVRRNGRDPSMWNQACDYAINGILIDAGITLPPKYLDDPSYQGMSADDIYSELRSFHPEEEKPSLSEGEGTEDGAVDMQDMDGKGKDGDGLGEGTDSNGGDAGGEGEIDDSLGGESGEDGNADGHGDPGGSGEVRDAPDSERGGGSDESPSDEEWELALAQAAQSAREVGELPGALERLINDVLHPKLDWQELLSRYISDRARDDYSWTPPSKRFLHLDVVLPSLSHQKLPEVVLAIDTSGSVTEAEMNQFAAEVSGILESFDTTIHVVYCDSEVKHSDTFGRCDLPLEIRPEGGGGTDFRPAFAWVEKEGLDPACLVYLTDLECLSFPDREPDYPVLWAQVGQGGKVVPFGDVIEIR